MIKRPYNKFDPPVTKDPRVSEDPKQYYDRQPAWRISKLDMVDPFGWHEVDSITLDEIRQKLSDVEGRTWKEILVTSGKYNHLVPAAGICKEGRKRLEAMKLDDVEQLLSLRLSGKVRVWGVLTNGVCNLIWWDPEHRVWPTQPKNT